MVGLIPGGSASTWAEEDDTSAPETPPPENREPVEEEKKSDWKIKIGLIGGYSPEYDGSDEYDFFWAPRLRIAWRDTIILTESSLRAQARHGHFRFGPVLKHEKGRSDDDDDDIKGVGDVDSGLGVGAFAKYKRDGYSLELQVRKEVAGGHGGILGELKAEIKLPNNDQPWGKLGSELTFGDDEYMEEFYGINDRQSARSGLSTFDADAGVRSISLYWATEYDFTQNWAIGGRIEYLRMVGDAADSPIVDDAGSPNNVTLALGLTYTF